VHGHGLRHPPKAVECKEGVGHPLFAISIGAISLVAIATRRVEACLCITP
jgi:hypothetical protein